MREKRYIWLPLVLLLYGAVMAIWFGRDFVASGRTLQLIIFCAVDLLVCILLFMFLKKKQSYKQRY